MPSRVYIRYKKVPSGSNVLWEHCNQHWSHSPRVNGKLQLRAQACTMEYVKTLGFSETKYSSSVGPDPSVGIGQLWNLVPVNWSSLEAESYARFRGRLYSGSAALGVTFASAKQSAEMIRVRLGQLAQKADRTLASLTGASIKPKAYADAHLEMIFGWVPLVKDVHAAVTSVVQQADRLVWVSGTAKQTIDNYQLLKVGNGRRASRAKGKAWVTRSAGVLVRNPNLWLAERAGLLNPATVAWDLVPWSFLVNMFVNVNQVVQSLSDFAGLEFVNSSETRSLEVIRVAESTTMAGFQLPGGGLVQRQVYSGFTSHEGRYKYRTLRADVPPPLVLKIPELNASTLAMAASLLTQKVSRISHLFKKGYTE